MASKAKAAAKQAAAKGKGRAVVPITPTPSAPVSAPKPSLPRPSVTQYWADSASTQPAPGGGIQRIGYDQATFEKAVQAVIVDPQPAPQKIEEVVEEGEEGKVAEVMEVVKVEVKKEDIAVLVKEMEMTAKEAEEVLKSVGGVLLDALLKLTGPVPVKVIPGRGTAVVA